MDRHRDTYILYSGMVDFNSGKTVSLEQVEPKNINPRSSIEALMNSYKHAIALRELCTFYEEADFHKTERMKKGVEKYIRVAEVIIREGDSIIKRNLEDLPDSLG